MTITNSPSGRRTKRPTGQPPNRLPSSRERRPALVALAFLLIAGGAVLAGWLALRQSHTDTYLIVDQKVPTGEQIQASDLRKIELPSEGVDFVPSSSAAEVIDSYAMADLLEGTVIAPGMYGDAPELQADQDRIGLDLDPGKYPQGLEVGDQVVVLLSSEAASTPRMLSSGTVRSIRQADTGGGASVDVVVSNRCSAQFAAGSANGDVAVYQVAPNSEPITCQAATRAATRGPS